MEFVLEICGRVSEVVTDGVEIVEGAGQVGRGEEGVETRKGPVRIRVQLVFLLIKSGLIFVEGVSRDFYLSNRQPA